MIEGAQDYGYTSAKAGATQLSRDVYAVKVKDANKIDNDHKYIALDHMHRYIVADEADIQAGKNGLTWAIFYLKENNNVDGTPYYALVNQNSVWTKTGADKKEIILNITRQPVRWLSNRVLTKVISISYAEQLLMYLL